MKSRTSLIALSAFFFCGPLLANLSKGQPNIVVILADDQGWGDLSLHGNTDLRTPQIDSLASDGASFHRFFVQPVCAPTRAEFLTGRFFSRTGVRGVSTGKERMNPDETTLAELLRDAGYKTAAFGKWHNGSQSPYHPNDQGFEHFHGFTSGHWGDYFDPILEENGKLVRGKGYITDHLTDQAMRFMEENRDEPFFCYVPFCTPHSPMQVPDRFYKRFTGVEPQQSHWQRKGNLAHTRAALAMVENLDWNVGRILSHLEELGVAENTIVIYFSDNGPNGYRWNGGMRGIKGSVDEGGVRVPCLIRWPERIPAGLRVERISGAVDLLPTLAAAVGLNLPAKQPLDGVNLLPHLTGGQDPPEGRMLIHLQVRGSKCHWSVRGERFRLLESGKLVDPVVDPRQETDLAAKYPAEVTRMRSFADDYLKETKMGRGEDNRPFSVGHSPTTWLPARDGVPHGEVKRSGRAPNCSFFTNWRTRDDRITWDIHPGKAGLYEVWMHYTCPEESIGSTVELRFGAAAIRKTIRQAHDPPLRGSSNDRSPRHGSESFVKDFLRLPLGSIELTEERGLLELRASKISRETVADIRWLELRRIDGK